MLHNIALPKQVAYKLFNVQLLLLLTHRGAILDFKVWVTEVFLSSADAPDWHLRISTSEIKWKSPCRFYIVKASLMITD